MRRGDVGQPSVEGSPATVPIGPLRVAALSRKHVIDAIASGAAAALGQRPYLAYALHVGGLNARHNGAYRAAMTAADLVYADGASVVLLAKLAGAKQVERAGTTDIGHDVLTALQSRLGRPVRLALVGGPDGLARSAGEVLAEQVGCLTVLAEHGYHEDWAPVLSRLRNADADVVLVGLGVPAEMRWVEHHRARLPAALVMTCGGWFGFLVGQERRAPRWLQNAGGEWLYRMSQAPGRLGPRYLRGIGATLVLGISTLRAPAGGPVPLSQPMPQPRTADTVALAAAGQRAAQVARLRLPDEHVELERTGTSA